MKKLKMLAAMIILAGIFTGCASNGGTSAQKANQNSKIDEKNLDNYLVDSDYDFIYEVVNKFNVNVTVSPFVHDSKKDAVSITSDVVIAPGESYAFKFNTKTLFKTFGEDISIRCYFQPEGYNKSRGWISDLYSDRNTKHTVTIVKKDDGWSGENSWEYFGPELVIYKDGDFSCKIVNKTDYSVKIQGYVRDPDKQAVTKEVVLKAGQAYDFRYKMEEVAAVCENNSFGLGFSFEMPEKDWYWGGMEDWYNKNELNKVENRIFSIIPDGNGSFTFEE
ncbi:MAG: hypothetical protein PUC37_13180 [Spirochaetales bacterium]|nr:hypothetical protein [Spirochaetales bacterium]